LTKLGTTVPVVQTDSSWRVSSGSAVHYSDSRYSQSSAWTAVREVQLWSAGTVWTSGSLSPAWNTATGDLSAYWISTTHSYTSTATYPTNQSVLFRDTQPINLTSPVDARLTYTCDDTCDIWMDGSLVATSSPAWTTVSQTDITLSEGQHTFGINLTNGSGASGVIFSATDKNTGATLTNTNATRWVASNSWYTNTKDPYSFDGTYVSNPNLPSSAIKVLVVGGGGGGGSDMGGGGGGGGVVYKTAYSVPAQSPITVTVGSGGTGAPAGISQARGQNGGNSVFGSLVAFGGGGGGSEYSTNVSIPGTGASAGGTAGCTQSSIGGAIYGQGNPAGVTIGCYYPTGGGGAGGAGSVNPGHGGIGVSNSILGTAYYWGGGGGGSGYTGIGGNGGNGGGGGGAVGTTTGGSGLNPGSAGGGGTTVAQTNKPGGNAGANTGGGGGGGSHYNSNNYGGNGGSGIVIISYTTGTMTATGGTITTSGGNTIHTFTSSGTFTVTSIP
jgi:hypothetical protein